MTHLVTAEEMREIDRKAVEAGVPALLLMENAGMAVAREVRQLAGAGHLVSVLVGPGQNGGDGLCAARHLASGGFRVRIALFGDPARMPNEARVNLDALAAYPVAILRVGEGELSCREALEQLRGPQVIVDALLGTGQKGSPRPPLDEAVEWVNDTGAPVVSCDVPTGVDADTGNVSSPAINARVTVTFGIPKAGLYVYPGRKLAGRIVVESLGLPPDLLARPSTLRAITMDNARRILPTREVDHHKGLSGHVLVVAGSTGMPGAAILAARAVLRSGAGTATLLCPKGIYGACAGSVPEVMVLPCGDGGTFAPSDETLDLLKSLLSKSRSVALGPGLGRGEPQEAFLRECLPMIAALGTPCVLDADALYGLGALGGLSYLADLEGKFILTPHPGEMSRLMGVGTAAIETDRLRAAKEAALQGKSIVCLKGAGTCVSNSVGDVTVNTTGDPAMATAGSGDVLTGVIAALISQGLSLFEAAWLGVFWHGLSGEMAGRGIGSYGILAGEICDCLPEARKVIAGGERPL